MRNSITVKLILSYAAVIFMMAGLSTSFISLFSDGYILSESNKQLKKYADEFVLNLTTQQSSIITGIRLDLTLNEMATKDYAVAIFNKNNELERHTHYESFPISLEDFVSAVKPKINYEGANVLKHSSGNYALFTRHIYDVDTDERIALVFYMQVGRYGIDRSLFTLYLMSICVATLFAVCFALIFSSTLTLNLKKLKVRANMLAKRRYDCSIKIDSNDEVGELSDAFDAGCQTYLGNVAEI